jgi:hypothetical protein
MIRLAWIFVNEDGSIFMAATFTYGGVYRIGIYRTWDYGVTWHLIGEKTTAVDPTAYRPEVAVAIGRIEEILVLGFSYYTAGNLHYLKVYASDDYGTSWGLSDVFVEDGSAISLMPRNCIQFLNDYDGGLCLYYIRYNGAANRIYASKSFDSINWAVGIDTTFHGESFSVTKDYNGNFIATWLINRCKNH